MLCRSCGREFVNDARFRVFCGVCAIEASIASEVEASIASEVEEFMATEDLLPSDAYEAPGISLRVLACGGRDFQDYDIVRAVLGNLAGPVVLCHGGARGADSLAGRYACERGWGLRVYRAEWKRYGKAAGARRNQRMLDDFKPDVVVAFPGGRGTADMVARSVKAGVCVWDVEKGDVVT
jgi:hypothetical protein